MPTRSATASGKIILSGEYAVVFGKKGIAIASESNMIISLDESQKNDGLTVVWSQSITDPVWTLYAQKVATAIIERTQPLSGTLVIENNIPLGKGMGSSTALIIAMCRCMLGTDCEATALAIENELNPGNSGIDFAVIWEERPILFSRGKTPEVIELPEHLLAGSRLIDTGKPNETTPELVGWVKEKYAAELQQTRVENPLPLIQGELRKMGAGFLPAVDKKNQTIEAIETIGNCTERILSGEALKSVMHDHHRAQVALGVVPEHAQKIIADIEAAGGAAKVIGAGGRTGGGGMVLAIA